MQDRGIGGCVPGGQSSTYSETGSCAYCGKNDYYINIIIVTELLLHAIAPITIKSEMFSYKHTGAVSFHF